MRNNTFRCFDRDISTGLSSVALRELSEQISVAKRMPLEDVELRLKEEQTKAATALNSERRAHNGPGFTFICS